MTESIRSGAAQLAYELDRALDFQPALTFFRQQIWERGLRDALRTSPRGGVQVRRGLVHVNAVIVQTKAFLCRVAVTDDPKANLALVGEFADPAQTLYFQASDATPTTASFIVQQLAARWPSTGDLLGSLTYPDNLTGL